MMTIQPLNGSDLFLEKQLPKPRLLD